MSSERSEQSRAERQIANARRDPRLDHKPEAVVADWWAAVESVERARMLAIWGIDQLIESHPNREVVALAEADRDNDFAELNAMALTSLLGALDAMVEGFAPRARDITIRAWGEQLVKQAIEQVPDAAEQLEEAQRERLEQVLRELIEERLPSLTRASGGGAQRWEKVLAAAGLAAPRQRPIPGDLDITLQEVVALRHVLLHRGGRVDARALRDASTLRYQDGELVRISRPDYRIYSAAVRAYGNEVSARPLGPDHTPFDLTSWRDNYDLST